MARKKKCKHTYKTFSRAECHTLSKDTMILFFTCNDCNEELKQKI